MAGNQVPFDQLKVPANKYGTDGSSLPEYQRAFIERFAPYAMLAASQTGLPARFLLAEASIETDWGRSGSATRGNNMFGIKASKGQIAAGVPVEYLPTTEYINGVKTTEVSPFIKYKTAEDGFNGFVEKLQRTKYPDQKALLNHRSDTPLSQDDATEKALSDAFGRTSYLTMPGINQTMLDRMARFPADLQKAGFKTAVDFSKASNDLAGLVGYDGGRGYPDASNGLDNDGLGSLGINGITFNRTPSSEGTLDYLSNQLTGGLRDVGSTIADAYANVTGRLPSVGELKNRVDDVASGARSLFDQLGDIAGSAEAKTFAQSTGIDPSQYVLNDIYRLGLNRDVDAGSAASQLEVLRNQGGQSLFNQLTNSQEGRTLALNNLYENAFSRGIDQGGLGKYLSDLAAGKSMAAVQTDVLSSPEAQALGITPDQFASIIGASSLTPTIGPNGFATPVGPGPAVGTIGAGPTQYPVGPGSTTYPVGPGGFEVGTVPPGPTQGTINTGTEVSPVGPDGFEVKPVGPEGSEVGTVPPPALSPDIRNFYEAYLHRAPDAQGAIEYQGQLDRGISPSIIEAQILSAPEAVQALTPEEMANQTAGYKAKYGLLPEEVKTLAPLASDFARVVGRPVDTPTLQYWDQQIDAGTPQSILEAQILTAPETQALGLPALTQAVQDYQTQYALKPEEVTAIGPLASEFARVLDRPADIPTIQAWDAQLDSGITMPELQARLLQAPEVLGRTGGAGDAYTAFQGQYGRSPSDYLAALTDPTKFSGANVSGNLGPGTWNGTFDPSAYLAANPDVAAAGANPLAHFVQFGMSEGRAVDTAGHHLPQNFDGNAYLAANPDVARAGMSPLDHYLRFGAAEGRAAPSGTNNYSFTNLNASQGLGPVGNGTFSGTFDGNSYLAANRDVAASGMSPLDHYLRYGYGEGRAIDTQGDRISNFDGNAYLAANRDVAAAGMDPLRHYLLNGASEGRAAPTGANNYSFSNFNTAQGLGPTGNGTFGLNGIGSTAPAGMGTTAPAPTASLGNPLDSYGFTSMNAGTYAAPGSAQQPSQVSWESAAPNALPGSGGAGGSAFEYKDNRGQTQIATFNPQASENAYLAGQVAQNQQQIEAGRSPFANNPNLWNADFARQNFVMQAQNQFAPTPFFTATPATYALPSPVAPTVFMPPPVMNQGLRVNPYGGFGLISAF